MPGAVLRREDFLKRREEDRLRMDPKLFSAITRWELDPEDYGLPGLDSVRNVMAYTPSNKNSGLMTDLGWRIPETYIQASEQRHREILVALYPDEAGNPYTYQHADMYNATDFFLQNIQGRQILEFLISAPATGGSLSCGQS